MVERAKKLGAYAKMPAGLARTLISQAIAMKSAAAGGAKRHAEPDATSGTRPKVAKVGFKNYARKI
jgi:hypothetical protein